MAEEPTAVKRGRGRPRKDGQLNWSSMPANPDCEPASKGYVKCIARALTKHVIDDSDAYVISAVAWLTLTLGFWGSTGFNFYQSIPITIIGAVMFMLFVHDTLLWYLIGHHATIKAYPFMEKYEPPACKEKQECEE